MAKKSIMTPARAAALSLLAFHAARRYNVQAGITRDAYDYAVRRRHAEAARLHGIILGELHHDMSFTGYESDAAAGHQYMGERRPDRVESHVVNELTDAHTRARDAHRQLTQQADDS